MTDDDKKTKDEPESDEKPEQTTEPEPEVPADVEEKPSEEAANPEEEKADEPDPVADTPQPVAPTAEPTGTDQQGRTLYNVKCSNCGKDTQVPFEPAGDRPVYCRDCYMQKKNSQG